MIIKDSVSEMILLNRRVVDSNLDRGEGFFSRHHKFYHFLVSEMHFQVLIKGAN